MKRLLLIGLTLVLNPLYAEKKLQVEVSATLGSNQNMAPQFEVITSQGNEPLYESLLLKTSYSDDQLSLTEFVQRNKELSLTELGEKIFDETNKDDALNRFRQGNGYLQNLDDRGIFQAVGTVFRALLGEETAGRDHVREVIGEFGDDASFKEKLLFIQVFAHISDHVYDGSKLRQEWSWAGDDEYISSTQKMLDAMRAWLNGEDVDEGVCFDTVLMMNDFAELLGFEGAMVLGTNRFGMMHPEGLYFDTSDPSHTKAILQDWERLAVIEVNTPTELANALSQIVGSHLFASILYDAKGRPLKMIHSENDLITLRYLGHQELLETIQGLLDNGLIEDEFLIRHSEVMAAVDYGVFRFEVRQFKNLVSDNNLMFISHFKPDPKSGDVLTYKHETELAYLKENKGLISDYNNQESNEHFSIIIRHAQKLSTRKMKLIEEMLTLSVYSGLEMILSYYDHQADSRYKPGVSIPIIESVTGVTFQLFDIEKNRVDLTISPFTSFDLLIPREARRILGSIKNMLNAAFKEARVLGQARVSLPNDQLLIFDASYAYSRIDHQLYLGMGFQHQDDISFKLTYERGFTNSNFPIFYRQDSSQIGFQSSVNIETNRNFDLGFDLNFKVAPNGNKTQMGFSGRISY